MVMGKAASLNQVVKVWRWWQRNWQVWHGWDSVDGVGGVGKVKLRQKSIASGDSDRGSNRKSLRVGQDGWSIRGNQGRQIVNCSSLGVA